jgi:hypothetical protein
MKRQCNGWVPGFSGTGTGGSDAESGPLQRKRQYYGRILDSVSGTCTDGLGTRGDAQRMMWSPADKAPVLWEGTGILWHQYRHQLSLSDKAPGDEAPMPEFGDGRGQAVATGDLDAVAICHCPRTV